jgi:hypothetical protein
MRSVPALQSERGETAGTAEFAQCRDVYPETLFAVSGREARDKTAGQDRHAGGRKQQEAMPLRQLAVVLMLDWVRGCAARLLFFPNLYNSL